MDTNTFISKLSEIQFDLKNFRQALKSLSAKYNKSFDELFEVFDTDQDGIIEMREFEQMMRVLKLSLNAMDLSEAFEIFDFDGNGKIGKSEFLNVVNDIKQNNKLNFAVVLQ